MSRAVVLVVLVLLAGCCFSGTSEQTGGTTGGSTSSNTSSSSGIGVSSTGTTGASTGASTTSGGSCGALTLSPDPLNLPSAAVGGSSSQTVSVTNTGSCSVTLSCICLDSVCGGGAACASSTGSFYVAGAPLLPATLAPDSSLPLTLIYTPSLGNAATVQLDVFYTASGASARSEATDPIRGSPGLPGPCALSVSPAALSFGTVSAGTPVLKAATFANLGQSACDVAVMLDATSDPAYAFAPGQATTFTVAGGTMVSVTLDFDLVSSGTPLQRTGRLDYSSNDPSHAVGSIPLRAYQSCGCPNLLGWPKWHFDSNNSGQTPADTSANTGQVVWTSTGLLASAVALNADGGHARCGGETYLSSPVVASNAAGDVVYQMSLDGTLIAFAQNGVLAWTLPLSSPAADPHPSTPVVAENGNVWVASGSGQSGDAGFNTIDDLYLVTPAASIQSQQSYGTAGFAAVPGLGRDGTLFEADGYAPSTSGVDPYTVMAFQANASGAVSRVAGQLLPLAQPPQRFGVAVGADDTSYWASGGQVFAVTPPSSGFAPTPAWPNGGVTLTTNAGDPNCVGPVISDLALDPLLTGFAFVYSAWEDGTGCAPTASCAEARGCVAPYTMQGQLVALSMATGAVQWTLNLPSAALPSGWSRLCSDYGSAAPAVASDGTVYVGNGDGLHAINGATGAQKWLFSSANVSTAPAIGGDGTVFFGCQDGTFYALHSDGSLRYQLSTAAPISSSPAIGAAGTVFFVSDNGTFWAVR